ncbi:spore germination protein [Paenibacillus sp. NAIST15-1]|uniref:spore germination protein n=1 Tax=Paenibacillus sp. NAIST15-1 TaxID=1605994 RepID=UPI0011152169|nr:spore germination protein [Paenibacillus sp. NAIST15-1]
MRRLQFLQMDEVMDGNTVAKYLENSPYSFFPQWYDTERPDAIASCLSLGKIALITDNSPSVMAAPARFLEFFASTGDAYERWHFCVFIRFLRLAAFMLTMRHNRMTAPLYIAEKHLNTTQPLIIENAQVRREIRVLRTDPHPEMEIVLTIKGATTSSLNELSNNKVGTSTNIAKELQRKYEQVIHFLQENRTDCLGVGMHVRNKIG